MTSNLTLAHLEATWLQIETGLEAFTKPHVRLILREAFFDTIRDDGPDSVFNLVGAPSGTPGITAVTIHVKAEIVLAFMAMAHEFRHMRDWQDIDTAVVVPVSDGEPMAHLIASKRDVAR